MSVRINAEQALDFIRYALDGAAPGVTFEVEAYSDASGRAGVRASSTAPGYGSRIYLFPPTGGEDWDAWSVVAAAVQQLTVGVTPPGVDRAA
ncbi:MAG: hypothetical protein ACJ8GN_20040 [Longimicrobiaceae bacterium]